MKKTSNKNHQSLPKYKIRTKNHQDLQNYKIGTKTINQKTPKQTKTIKTNIKKHQIQKEKIELKPREFTKTIRTH